VYQDAIRFVSWVDDLLDGIPKGLAVYHQLDRASTSIPLNIAEGNGKHTAPDRCRFFDIARGSALECAACLDVLVAKKHMVSADSGKVILVRIVSMLVGLIRYTSVSRVHENSVPYCAESPRCLRLRAGLRLRERIGYPHVELMRIRYRKSIIHRQERT